MMTLLFLVMSIPFVFAYEDGDVLPRYNFDKNIGDTILFYPLNREYDGNVDTCYSCFYNYKAIKFGFKSKYRFMANDQKQTNLSEIENNYFVVENVISGKILKKNKLCYLAELKRIKDQSILYLALPKKINTISNTSLTNFWYRQYNSEFFVNIPFSTKKFIDKLKMSENKVVYLVSHYSSADSSKIINNTYLPVTFANTCSKLDTLLSYISGFPFLVGETKYISLGKPLVYKQLYTTITDTLYNISYKIPCTFFVGNSNSMFIQRYKETNLFNRFFKEKEELIKRVSPISNKVDSLIGKEIYLSVTADNNFKNEIKYFRNITYNYDLKEGFYKFNSIELCPYLSLYQYYAVVTDSKNIKIILPVEYIERYSMSVKEKNNEIRIIQRKKTIELNKKKKLILKYGYIGEEIYNGYITESRYKKLVRKYGTSKARYMAIHSPGIGWTYKEVSEALDGYEYVSSNTWEDVYAYYETITYKRSEGSFTTITYKNGIVISVDDVDY